MSDVFYNISSQCLNRTCILSTALEIMTALGHLMKEDWLQLLIPYQVTKSSCLVDSLSRHSIRPNNVRDRKVITKLIVVQASLIMSSEIQFIGHES